MKFFVFLISIFLTPFLAGAEEVDIPKEYQGVWKIVLSVDENGNRCKSDEPEFAKQNPIEILIVGNRVIHVEEDGSSVLARAKVLCHDSGITLDLRTGICHDKEGSPTYWNLKLKNNRLIIKLAIDQYDKDPRTAKVAVPSFEAISLRR